MNLTFVLEYLSGTIKGIKNNNMLKKINILGLIIFINFLLVNKNVNAEEVRGFTAKNDVKIGPIINVGFPLSVNNSNISYLPNVSLDIHGESFLHGTTGFIFNWISSSRDYIPL